MDWGIPDYLDAGAYRDTDNWSLKRWRWEFTRRRADFRSDFLARYNETYEKYCAWAADPKNEIYFGRKPIAPGEPGFEADTHVEQVEKYGCPLFDPRIADHGSRLRFQPPLGRSAMARGGGAGLNSTATSVTLADGVLALSIDLDRPIGDQIKHAEWVAKEHQRLRHGALVGRRTRPALWPDYLRTLDAREAGASWRTIYDRVLSPTGRYSDKNPEKTASDVWEAARSLQFNFPI